jgi:hypothetical protein
MASSSTKRPVIIAPFPTLRKVGPYEFPTLQLPDCEHDLFDSIAQEHVNIHGTDIDYWSHTVDSDSRDPLYDEAIERVYKGPFRLKGYVSWPDSVPEARFEGERTTFGAEMWIARKTIEDVRAPSPNETDVVRIWNTPFFNAWAVDTQDVGPNAGYFFDVIDVDDDGHLFDSPQFVGFKLSIKRRTEFTPERRITNT